MHPPHTYICMDTHAPTHTLLSPPLYTPPLSTLPSLHTHLFLTALVGMLHVGVFLMLLLSGERNFGVRLNKPYTQKMPLQDIPKFSGTHADLLFLVRSCDIIYHHHRCVIMM